MAPRFFCPQDLRANTEIDLPSAVAHHAERVLRLSVGADITLFNGEGGEYPARVLAFGKQPKAQLGAHDDIERESPMDITLAQCLATGDKMDWVLQKAVELGARHIIPIASQRSVLKLSGDRADKRLAHWRQVLISACEQCGRNRVPTIADIRPLPQHLASSGPALRLILAPGVGAALHSMSQPDSVELLVGPEGGFSEEERRAALSAGYQALTLGPRILRTETAGLAALTALQMHWGDF